MQINKDLSLVKLLGNKLQEATILKTKYGEGTKFFYNGGRKDLDAAGYKKGDTFTVVKLKNKIDISVKSKDGETYLKTLQAPDGKKFTLSGSLTSYQSVFNHMKLGSGVTPA